MEFKRKITRREFLKASALAVAGTALAACKAEKTTEAPAPTVAVAAPTTAPTKPPEVKPTEAPVVPTEPPAPKYTEPPSLAAMVASSEIPDIEERLPANPMVFPMRESVGKHGGIIRRGFTGTSDRWGPTKLGDRGWCWFDENLIHRPRIAESWSLNDDASEWTFKLRQGMKWSDGTPYTSKDVKWYYDYEVMDKTLNPSVGSIYRTGPEKTPVELIVHDDYTVTWKFAHPNPLFLLRIGRERLEQPAHHMKQWHINTCDDKAALEKAATDAGFASWDKFYLDDRRWWYLNKDQPNLRPWIAKDDMRKSGELFEMVRNPYFWGVDEAGNQLPYFDGVNHRLFEDKNVFNLWIVNGEIDFQARHVDAPNYTLFKESEASGDYTVVVGVSAGHVAVQLNLATKNEQLNKFFNTRDVRIALSHAIDRATLNELIYNGLATPRQYSPLPVSPQYYEKLSNAYLEFDTDKANQLLDETEYKNKDADGFRTYPDGETINFTIEGTDQAGTPSEDAIQQIIKMWGAVGVKCAYKYFERALYSEHYSANEIEGAFWGGDRTVLPLAPEAIIFRGVQPDRPWAAGYGIWHETPESPGAVKPPDGHFIWKIWEIWDKVAVEPDPDKQNELFFQILDIWAEELPQISALGMLPSLAIVKNGIHNFVEGFPNDDTTGDENIFNTETYFWDEPEKHTG